MLVSDKTPSKNRRRYRILELLWLGSLLSSIVACGPPQETLAEPVATITRTTDLETTAQQLSTRMVNEQNLIDTSEAEETISASHTQTPEPLETTTPPIPQPSATSPQPTSEIPSLPDDIPIPKGEKINLFASTNLVSFLIQTEFTPLLLFFENQMPGHQWIRQSTGSFITNSSATLNFVKGDRKVNISLRANQISGLTGIVITLQQ